MRKSQLILVSGLLLTQLAGCPFVTEATGPGATVTTSLGEFVIELDPAAAPETVANFQEYAESGFYDGTVIHRVVAGSLIEGGGYAPGLVQKQTRPAIVNEADNGLTNVRGSVGMARTDDPDSATSQFYVNVVDNATLDPTADSPGYAVFGHVVEGMDVIDALAALPTGQRDGMTDVPTEDVFIDSTERLELPSGDATVPGVRVNTSRGPFVIELDPARAPVTVENFLHYVDDGFYPGTVFHRVVADFVVQGGGSVPGMVAKQAGDPVVNESPNGLANLRGTVAMAYADDPAAATSQFLVNVAANPALDATATQPGHTVFGRVFAGMDVVDAIAAVQTGDRDGLPDCPLSDVTVEKVELTTLALGRPALTPEGEAFAQEQVLEMLSAVEYQQYQILNLIRDLIIQVLGFAITNT